MSLISENENERCKHKFSSARSRPHTHTHTQLLPFIQSNCLVNSFISSKGRFDRFLGSSTSDLTTVRRFEFIPQSLPVHAQVSSENQLGLVMGWRSVVSGCFRDRQPVKVLYGLSHLLWTNVVNWMSWSLDEMKEQEIRYLLYNYFTFFLWNVSKRFWIIFSLPSPFRVWKYKTFKISNFR